MNGRRLRGVTLQALRHRRVVANIRVSRFGSYTGRLQPGQYTLRGTATGFMRFQRRITIREGRSRRARIFMNPTMATGQIRLVLTWNRRISDLDMHLTTPSGCKVDWRPGHRRCESATSIAHLDVDDTNGEGPETISIDRLEPGQYRLWIHRYSAGNILRSDATVRAFFPSGAVRTYRVGQDGRLRNAGSNWDVLTVDGATGNIFGTVMQGTSWATVPGTPAVFTSLTTSQSGLNVWGCAGGNIYRRAGVTNANKMGTGWLRITGPHGAQGVASSDLGVWIWTTQGRVYARRGVTPSTPAGSSWTSVPWSRSTQGDLRTISFDGANAVATSSRGDIWWRAGIVAASPQGSRWFQVPGHMTWVGVYSTMLWGTRNGRVYRRLNMATSPPAGTGWSRVPGQGQKIAVSNGIVWMVNANGRVYYRKGIRASHRMGSSWGQLGSTERRLKAISAGNGVVWGLDWTYSPVFRQGVSRTGTR